MRISGQRIKRTQFVQTDRHFVAVDVELVIPGDDPSYESETDQLLKEIEAHACQGDVNWLERYGKGYKALNVT